MLPLTDESLNRRRSSSRPAFVTFRSVMLFKNCCSTKLPRLDTCDSIEPPKMLDPSRPIVEIPMTSAKTMKATTATTVTSRVVCGSEDQRDFSDDAAADGRSGGKAFDSGCWTDMDLPPYGCDSH